MLGLVKRDEHEFDAWLKKRYAEAASMLEGWGLDPRELLSTEIGWLLCLSKYEAKSIDFDMFQVGFLVSRSRLRSLVKARQVGFSFGISCEATARCHLKERHTAVCISYNLNDAKEKITLAKELHDELPLEYQKKIVIDRATTVGFASNSSKRRVSRIVSQPAKAPRGKSGDVYLDELAHCQNDKAIYAGATALITRSKGQLTIGSTPLGRRGVFHAVHTQEFDRDKYRGYARQSVPWWLSRCFCVDVAAATDPATGALTMSTEERVERFGNAELKTQFDALPIEDFQQEYELAFQDERVSFFPYELIMPCCQKERFEIPVYDNLAMLAEKAPDLGPLCLGYDVGRVKHPSELTVFDEAGDFSLRFDEQFRDVPFPRQRARLFKICDDLGEHWKVFRIDSTGLGKNLGEDLQARYGKRRVILIDFTMQSKERLANSFKILLQEKRVVLPNDKRIYHQIHAIKQKITSAGNAVFDAERNRHHHADKFWSMALATFKKREKKRVVAELGVRTFGDDAPQSHRVDPERGILERLIDVPAEHAVAVVKQAEAARAREMAWGDLERAARVNCVAARVWNRQGDKVRARVYAAEYKRLRREIRRRQRATTIG